MSLIPGFLSLPRSLHYSETPSAMPPRLTRAQRRAQDWCQKDNPLFPVPRDTGPKASTYKMAPVLGNFGHTQDSQDSEDSQDSKDSQDSEESDDGSEDSVQVVGDPIQAVCDVFGTVSRGSERSYPGALLKHLHVSPSSSWRSCAISPLETLPALFRFRNSGMEPLPALQSFDASSSCCPRVRRRATSSATIQTRIPSLASPVTAAN
jgi:hypothetical protein